MTFSDNVSTPFPEDGSVVDSSALQWSGSFSGWSRLVLPWQACYYEDDVIGLRNLDTKECLSKDYLQFKKESGLFFFRVKNISSLFDASVKRKEAPNIRLLKAFLRH